MASYISNPDVLWVVEMKGIMLINNKSGEGLFLEYPEAALWDFLSRNLSMNSTIKKLAAITGMEEENAVKWIYETVEFWRRGGWVSVRLHSSQ